MNTQELIEAIAKLLNDNGLVVSKVSYTDGTPEVFSIKEKTPNGYRHVIYADVLLGIVWSVQEEQRDRQ